MCTYTLHAYFAARYDYVNTYNMCVHIQCFHDYVLQMYICTDYILQIYIYTRCCESI